MSSERGKVLTITSVELVIYSDSHTKPTSHGHTEQAMFCQCRNTSVLVIIKLLVYIHNNHFKSSSPSFYALLMKALQSQGFG